MVHEAEALEYAAKAASRAAPHDVRLEGRDVQRLARREGHRPAGVARVDLVVMVLGLYIVLSLMILFSVVEPYAGPVALRAGTRRRGEGRAACAEHGKRFPVEQCALRGHGDREAAIAVLLDGPTAVDHGGATVVGACGDGEGAKKDPEDGKGGKYQRLCPTSACWSCPASRTIPACVCLRGGRNHRHGHQGHDSTGGVQYFSRCVIGGVHNGSRTRSIPLAVPVHGGLGRPPTHA